MTNDDKMTIDERRKYLRIMQKRYTQASHRNRSLLLNEMEHVTGLDRKTLLRAMRADLEETRRALQDLRASPLQDLGLARAVRSLAEGVASRSGTKLELNIAEQIGALAPEVEQSYYRVAQEALENVAKHADARWIAVTLGQAAGRLTLEVSDDGQGFAADSAATEYQFGLKGMRERAEMIGAMLEVDSRPAQGTTIRLNKEVAP